MHDRTPTAAQTVAGAMRLMCGTLGWVLEVNTAAKRVNKEDESNLSH